MENSDVTSSGGMMAGLGIFVFVYYAFLIAVLIANWKVYTKAGKPGWASIVPIYSAIVLCEIIGKPGWWWLLCLIPVAGLYFAIVMVHRLSVSFGQGVGTTILIFLGIGILILGFGSAKYVGAPAS